MKVLINFGQNIVNPTEIKKKCSEGKFHFTQVYYIETEKGRAVVSFNSLERILATLLKPFGFDFLKQRSHCKQFKILNPSELTQKIQQVGSRSLGSPNGTGTAPVQTPGSSAGAAVSKEQTQTPPAGAPSPEILQKPAVAQAKPAVKAPTKQQPPVRPLLKLPEQPPQPNEQVSVPPFAGSEVQKRLKTGIEDFVNNFLDPYIRKQISEEDAKSREPMMKRLQDQLDMMVSSFKPLTQVDAERIAATRKGKTAEKLLEENRQDQEFVKHLTSLSPEEIHALALKAYVEEGAKGLFIKQNAFESSGYGEEAERADFGKKMNTLVAALKKSIAIDFPSLATPTDETLQKMALDALTKAKELREPDLGATSPRGHSESSLESLEELEMRGHLFRMPAVPEDIERLLKTLVPAKEDTDYTEAERRTMLTHDEEFQIRFLYRQILNQRPLPDMGTFLNQGPGRDLLRLIVKLIPIIGEKAGELHDLVEQNLKKDHAILNAQRFYEKPSEKLIRSGHLFVIPAVSTPLEALFKQLVLPKYDREYSVDERKTKLTHAEEFEVRRLMYNSLRDVFPASFEEFQQSPLMQALVQYIEKIGSKLGDANAQRLKTEVLRNMKGAFEQERIPKVSPELEALFDQLVLQKYDDDYTPNERATKLTHQEKFEICKLYREAIKKEHHESAPAKGDEATKKFQNLSKKLDAIAPKLGPKDAAQLKEIALRSAKIDYETQFFVLLFGLEFLMNRPNKYDGEFTAEERAQHLNQREAWEIATRYQIAIEQKGIASLDLFIQTPAVIDLMVTVTKFCSRFGPKKLEKIRLNMAAGLKSYYEKK